MCSSILLPGLALPWPWGKGTQLPQLTILTGGSEDQSFSRFSPFCQDTGLMCVSSASSERQQRMSGLYSSLLNDLGLSQHEDTRVLSLLQRTCDSLVDRLQGGSAGRLQFLRSLTPPHMMASQFSWSPVDFHSISKHQG